MSDTAPFIGQHGTQSAVDQEEADMRPAILIKARTMF